MIVWFGIFFLSLFSVLLIGWNSRRNIAVVRNDPLSFYKAQLADIQADVATGMLSKADAETASLEIKRRLIKASDKSTISYDETRGGLAFYALGASMIVAALLLYIYLGRPDIAAHPYKAPEVMDRQISANNPTTFNEAIAAIRLRLEKAPDDLQGWTVLASTLSSLRRHEEAAAAYSQATKLDPKNTDFHLKLGEQIMAMHGGQVVPAASYAFQTVLRLSPTHPGAQFYLGLAQSQAGNADGARQIWQALIAASTPDAPWLPIVRQHIADLDTPVQNMAGPSNSDVEAVSNMSEDEQTAFIDAMIGKLRAKLQDSPTDAKGWMMLARSEQTRGNTKAAIQALEDGIKSVLEADKEPLKIYLNELQNL